MPLTPQTIAGLLLGFETSRMAANLARKDPHMKKVLAQMMLASIADGSMWKMTIFAGEKAEIVAGQEPAFVHEVVEELLRQHALRETA